MNMFLMKELSSRNHLSLRLFLDTIGGCADFFLGVVVLFAVPRARDCVKTFLKKKSKFPKNQIYSYLCDLKYLSILRGPLYAVGIT